jgi:hypothetical protein
MSLLLLFLGVSGVADLNISVADCSVAKSYLPGEEREHHERRDSSEGLLPGPD